MTAFACFLRGINVGGNNPLKMAELRAMFASLGFENVASYIASGNIVFVTDLSATAATNAIVGGIRDAFGYELPVTLRSAEELDAVVATNPYPDEAANDPKKVVVFFLDGAPDPSVLADVLAAYEGPERAELQGREIFVHFPDGQGRSKFPTTKLERALGVSSTARNWNTVLKVQDLLLTL